MKVEVAYSKMQHCSTLDAPKLLNDTKNSHPISQPCLLKGKKYKMLQSKKPIKQPSSRRKSAPLTSVKQSHSLPDLSSLKLLNMNRHTTSLSKVTAPKCDFYASSIVQSLRTAR